MMLMKQDYLAKAAHAQYLAAQAQDVVEKRFWRQAAEDYRRLAVFVAPGSRGLAWDARPNSDLEGRAKVRSL